MGATRGKTGNDRARFRGAHRVLFGAFFPPGGTARPPFLLRPNPENLAVLRATSVRRVCQRSKSSLRRQRSPWSATLFVSPGHSNHSLIEGSPPNEVEVEPFRLMRF